MGASMFEVGQRVQTPYGAGVVRSRRMGPPCYEEPEAYSVKLDGREHEGTMVRAELVAAYEPTAVSGACPGPFQCPAASSPAGCVCRGPGGAK